MEGRRIRSSLGPWEEDDEGRGLGAWPPLLDLVRAPMAFFSTRNAFLCNISSCSSSSLSTSPKGGVVSAKPVVVPSSGSLVLKAARLLSPPMQFEPSKLNVVFHGEEMGSQPSSTFPRTYTLTHCDFTANLTLAVSNSINIDQLRRWQTKIQKDDVVAEWKSVKEDVSLHVHCYVSGANLLQDLAAEFRYYIFSKELPLVLQAVLYGDSILFEEHPELLDAPVWVYFHSNTSRYNRLECWGPLKDATQRTLDDTSLPLQRVAEERTVKWASPKTILHALIAFLLVAHIRSHGVNVSQVT